MREISVRSLGWKDLLEKGIGIPAFLGFPGGSDGKESARNERDLGSIPGLGRSSGDGNSYPFQYSGLENSRDRGAWQSIVHGVAKSRTRLNAFQFSLVTKQQQWTLRVEKRKVIATLIRPLPVHP